jgi:energy-coupling factor transporter ATP-binding protein EcfA2
VRLTSLSVERLPGIDEPLHLPELRQGVNVIVGPNASGKSSLLRALLALLYPREHDGVMGVEARFVTSTGSTLTARRLGQEVAWEEAGRHAAPPLLPEPHLIGAYTLRLEDLVAADTAQRPVRGARRPAAGGPSAGATGRDLDAAIAERIVTQLTGGIDLGAVRGAIGGQAEAGKKLAGAVTAATKERNALEQGRAALHAREERLPALREELEAAREVARRGRIVDDAIQLLAARTALGEHDAELATYPPGMDALRGDEGESLARLEAASRTEEATVTELEREIDELRRGLDAARIREDLTSADVGLHLERAERLVDDDTKLAQKSTHRQELLAQLREVGRRVGANEKGLDGTGGVTVSDAIMHKVEELLEQRQSARADEDSLVRQRSRLQAEVDDAGSGATAGGAGAGPGVAPGAQPWAGPGAMHGQAPLTGSDDQLVRLRANLLRWLSAPPLEPRRPAWAWGAALALALSVACAGALEASAAVLLSLAGATVAWLVIAALVVPPVASAVREQVEAETDQARARHGLVGPATWEHAEVADLVAAIDADLAERARRAADRRRLAEAERGIDADLAAARRRSEEVQQEIDAMRVEHGFAVGPDVALASWLNAVRDHARVRVALAGVQAEGSALDRRVTEARAALRAFVASAGEAHAPLAAVDLRPDELRSTVRGLARAVEQRDADRLRLARLLSDRERSRAAVARLDHERGQLLAGAGLSSLAGVEGPETDAGPVARTGPKAELLSRLALLAGWRDLTQARRAAEAHVATLAQHLAGEGGLLTMVEAGRRDLLEEAAAACRTAQDSVDALAKTINQTEREIELTASDRRISQATARLGEAVEALSAHREEALRLAAAHFLLREVEAEHEVEARPPALERAAALFARFTREDFVLRFEHGGRSGGRLAAADRTGRLFELSELSTGTRAQLLIASRLAFALEAEATARGAAGSASADGQASAARFALPFFLDEALTTSDPQRFAAVATAILDVAKEEGRQFIYLSARDDDARLWHSAAAAHGSTVTVVQLGSHGAGKAASPAAS